MPTRTRPQENDDGDAPRSPLPLTQASPGRAKHTPIILNDMPPSPLSSKRVPHLAGNTHQHNMASVVVADDKPSKSKVAAPHADSSRKALTGSDRVRGWRNSISGRVAAALRRLWRPAETSASTRSPTASRSSARPPLSRSASSPTSGRLSPIDEEGAEEAPTVHRAHSYRTGVAPRPTSTRSASSTSTTGSSGSSPSPRWWQRLFVADPPHRDAAPTSSPPRSGVVARDDVDAPPRVRPWSALDPPPVSRSPSPLLQADARAPSRRSPVNLAPMSSSLELESDSSVHHDDVALSAFAPSSSPPPELAVAMPPTSLCVPTGCSGSTSPEIFLNLIENAVADCVWRQSAEADAVHDALVVVSDVYIRTRLSSVAASTFTSAFVSTLVMQSCGALVDASNCAACVTSAFAAAVHMNSLIVTAARRYTEWTVARNYADAHMINAVFTCTVWVLSVARNHFEAMTAARHVPLLLEENERLFGQWWQEHTRLRDLSIFANERLNLTGRQLRESTRDCERAAALNRELADENELLEELSELCQADSHGAIDSLERELAENRASALAAEERHQAELAALQRELAEVEARALEAEVRQHDEIGALQCELSRVRSSASEAATRHSDELGVLQRTLEDTQLAAVEQRRALVIHHREEMTAAETRREVRERAIREEAKESENALREELQRGSQSTEWMRVQNIGFQTQCNFAVMDAMSMRILVDSLARERDALVNERDGLVHERDELVDECDALRDELDDTRQECDQLRVDLAAIEDGVQERRAPSPAMDVDEDATYDEDPKEEAAEGSLALHWQGVDCDAMVVHSRGGVERLMPHGAMLSPNILRAVVEAYTIPRVISRIRCQPYPRTGVLEVRAAVDEAAPSWTIVLQSNLEGCHMETSCSSPTPWLSDPRVSQLGAIADVDVADRAAPTRVATTTRSSISSSISASFSSCPVRAPRTVCHHPAPPHIAPPTSAGMCARDAHHLGGHLVKGVVSLLKGMTLFTPSGTVCGPSTDCPHPCLPCHASLIAGCMHVRGYSHRVDKPSEGLLVPRGSQVPLRTQRLIGTLSAAFVRRSRCRWDITVTTGAGAQMKVVVTIGAADAEAHSTPMICDAAADDAVGDFVEPLTREELDTLSFCDEAVNETDDECDSITGVWLDDEQQPEDQPAPVCTALTTRLRVVETSRATAAGGDGSLSRGVSHSADGSHSGGRLASALGGPSSAAAARDTDNRIALRNALFPLAGSARRRTTRGLAGGRTATGRIIKRTQTRRSLRPAHNDKYFRTRYSKKCPAASSPHRRR